MGQPVNGVSTSTRAGEILGGKYRLERKLGEGAMGTVWSAMHLTLGQRVAIKLIAAEHAQSVEARIRFSTEAKAAARLKSRHVVQVYDDGETEQGTPYIVMEYLDGETLEARLDREHGLQLHDAVRITAQVARALSRAHARGIVHRDLKPGNIFLARNDEDELGWTAKVLDFGIAKVDEQRDKSTTKTGAVLGTPLFMSPEQVRGASSVDHRTDLYALGVCFFNMLTGRYAFDGDTFGNILISICTEPLPDLKQAAPFVSDAVAAWFERCCARTPEARFQSADELIEQLQIAVGGDMPLLLRANPPQDFRGPSGTIRGHAAPLGPQTRAISTDGSGSFLAQQQAPARPEAATRSSTDSAPSVLTVHEAKSQSATYSLGVKRTAAGAFALLAALAAAFMLRTRAPVAAPPAVSINARTSALAATPGLATAAPPPKAIEAPSLPPAEAPSAPATSAPVTSSAPPSQAKPRPAPGAAPRSAPRVRAKSRGSSTDLGF